MTDLNLYAYGIPIIMGMIIAETIYSKINNLIEAEINNGSKDYDKEYIRRHINSLTT